MSKNHKDFRGITNLAGDTFTNPQIEGALYVNGALKEPNEDGVITLSSQSTYVIKGRLYGRIVIGDATETALANDTSVILDGVEIFSNDANAYCIYYASASQTMYVTLAKNKNNILYCQFAQSMQAQQGASLYSKNNMVVQGAGYLSCINRGGHGIRASELRISGNPHIYAEAVHDGIHGNSKLAIDGGFYYINGANDAFGTGETGNILLLGGTFRAYNIQQNVFDSKVAGYYLSGLDVLSDIDTSSSAIFRNMTTFESTYFATGTVTNGGTPVTAVNGVYTCGGGEDVQVRVSGYVNGRIVISNPKTDVVLAKAFINATNGPAISCGATSSKTVIKTDKDIESVNIILQSDVTGEPHDALSVSNNMEIEVKGGSFLVVRSIMGSGISASEIRFQDSNGVFLCKGCGAYGAKGSAFDILKNTDGATKTYKVAGAVILLANKLADVYARTSSSGKKATVNFDTPPMTGVFVAGSILTDKDSTNGSYVDFKGSRGVFYDTVSTKTVKQDPGKTYEPFDVIPYGIGAMPM